MCKQSDEDNLQKMISTKIHKLVGDMLKNNTDGIKRLIQDKTISMNDKNKDGHTLLGLAALYGNVEVAKRMRTLSTTCLCRCDI